jgi:5-bromo-4-chloroindolyl phosphate hydrolysis protein
MRMTWREVAKKVAQMSEAELAEFVDITYLPRRLVVTDDLINQLEKVVGQYNPGVVVKCMNKGHGVVQQYTEICLSCGRNTYETKEEYYQHLMGKRNGR